MATSRGIPEDQESSIKTRANEVFSEEQESSPIKAFGEYLQNTPATPLSPELKALLWVVALVVLLLFIGAILRIQRGGRRPRAPIPPAPASRHQPQQQRSIRVAEGLPPSASRMDLDMS